MQETIQIQQTPKTQGEDPLGSIYGALKKKNILK